MKLDLTVYYNNCARPTSNAHKLHWKHVLTSEHFSEYTDLQMRT